MTTLAVKAFRPKTSICLQSNIQILLTSFFRVVLQRQFFEALVRAAAIKYSNRSDLPTLADKLEYMFKNKLTTFATKYKAKSIEEEVSGHIISISHFICRNNSRSPRKSLMSLRDHLRRSSLISPSPSQTSPSRISLCRLKKLSTCSRRQQSSGEVMANLPPLPYPFRISSAL